MEKMSFTVHDAYLQRMHSRAALLVVPDNSQLTVKLMLRATFSTSCEFSDVYLMWQKSMTSGVWKG